MMTADTQVPAYRRLFDMIPACLCYLVTVDVVAEDELRPLFLAIRTVETSGTGSPERQVGDNGRSLEPYQISYGYWADSGVRGHWTQCHGVRFSRFTLLHTA